MPDTFAAGREAKPAELAAFQQFNRHMDRPIEQFAQAELEFAQG